MFPCIRNETRDSLPNCQKSLISLLSGRALQWAKTMWYQNGPVTQSLQNSMSLQMSIYDDNVGLEKFIQHFIHVTQRMQDCLEDLTLQSSIQHRS